MSMLLQVYLRSFFLQTVWNYERMQNIGLLFSIYPQLKKLYYDSQEELRKACRRYLGYFNTHPYMAQVILGSAARMEEEYKKGDLEAIARQQRFRLHMAGPLAAMGDKIFWSIWRSISGLLGVLLIMMMPSRELAISIFYLAFYNIPVFFIKYRFLTTAYNDGEGIMKQLEDFNSSTILRILPLFGMLLIAVSILLIFLEVGFLKGGIFALTIVLVVLAREFIQLSSTRLLYAIVALTVLGNYLIS